MESLGCLCGYYSSNIHRTAALYQAGGFGTADHPISLSFVWWVVSPLLFIWPAVYLVCCLSGDCGWDNVRRIHVFSSSLDHYAQSNNVTWAVFFTSTLLMEQLLPRGGYASTYGSQFMSVSLASVTLRGGKAQGCDNIHVIHFMET